MGAAWTRLRGGEVTAWRAAASVGIGVCIGMTPLYGLHIVLVLAVCLPLRLDARIAYLAANISLPFFAPFLTWAEIQTGALVRGGAFLPIDRTALHAHGLRAFAGDLAVGTLILSPTSGALFAAITWFVVAVSPRKTTLGLAIEATAKRYPPRGPRAQARAKLATDPVTAALRGLGELGELCDVGCGAGYFSLFLLTNGQATRATGFDLGSDKIEVARKAGEGLAATFEVADAREAAIVPCDTVLIVDVLHYMTPDAQDALLARAVASARRRVVLREIDRRPGIFSAITRLAERTRKAPHARTPQALGAVLKAHGLSVTITPCDEGTPFANVFVVGERAEVR